MELVVEKPVSAFDLSGIECGYLLWGRHSSWEEGKAGIVTSATESQLTVQYHPGIGNVIRRCGGLINEWKNIRTSVRNCNGCLKEQRNWAGPIRHRRTEPE